MCSVPNIKFSDQGQRLRGSKKAKKLFWGRKKAEKGDLINKLFAKKAVSHDGAKICCFYCIFELLNFCVKKGQIMKCIFYMYFTSVNDTSVCQDYDKTEMTRLLLMKPLLRWGGVYGQCMGCAPESMCPFANETDEDCHRRINAVGRVIRALHPGKCERCTKGEESFHLDDCPQTWTSCPSALFSPPSPTTSCWSGRNGN